MEPFFEKFKTQNLIKKNENITLRLRIKINFQRFNNKEQWVDIKMSWI